jgi:hypothetical protein
MRVRRLPIELLFEQKPGITFHKDWRVWVFGAVPGALIWAGVICFLYKMWTTSLFGLVHLLHKFLTVEHLYGIPAFKFIVG